MSPGSTWGASPKGAWCPNTTSSRRWANDSQRRPCPCPSPCLSTRSLHGNLPRGRGEDLGGEVVGDKSTLGISSSGLETMPAEIIAIGTELLLGEIQDTNTQRIARGLRSIGLDLYRSTVVGDNLERIAAGLRGGP